MSVDALPPALYLANHPRRHGIHLGAGAKSNPAIESESLVESRFDFREPLLAAKVVGPATKKSSFSFFAAEINCSSVSAKTKHGRAAKIASRQEQAASMAVYAAS